MLDFPIMQSDPFQMPFQSPIDAIVEAERLLAAGQMDQAARLAESVLINSPQVALALNVIGHVLVRRGEGQQAMALWEIATKVGPGVPQPWVSLGEALFHLGQPDKAAGCFREALARNPNLPDVWINQGIALQNCQRHEEAVESLRRGLTANPGHSEAALALATSLHSLGRNNQAIETLTKAAEKHPKNGKIWGNLGVLHEKADNLSEAVKFYDKAIALGPDDAQALFNRGSSLVQMLRLAEARRDWNAAVRIKPEDALTKNNLAILELLDGNLPLGFDLFEARWQVRHKKFPIPLPEWDGSSLSGKHILLYVEQGLGDMLQFCRYVPLLKRKYACRISIAALPTLHGVLRSLEGADLVVDIHPPYPAADVQCSLLTVPRFVGTTLETIPAEVPYLHADPASAARWKDRIAGLPGGNSGKRRVGLFWQGTQVDPNRTIRLADLAALFTVPNTQFVSLQKGPGEEELSQGNYPISAIGHELTNYSDTAAVLANLDLLITIDTSIAHCAGAMARPTWTFIPYRPDWRWLMQRPDSPWYPTMKLYRQHTRKDWSQAIAAVAADLSRESQR